MEYFWAVQSYVSYMMWCGRSWLLSCSVIFNTSGLPSHDERWWFQFPPSDPLFSQQEEGQVEGMTLLYNPKVAHITSVYMPLSKLSHMATPSCISKAGKYSLVRQLKLRFNHQARWREWILGQMAIPITWKFVITEPGQNSKVKRSLETDPKRGLVQITQARGRPMLGFRPNSKPSAQNWERNCQGVGVRDCF